MGFSPQVQCSRAVKRKTQTQDGPTLEILLSLRNVLSGGGGVTDRVQDRISSERVDSLSSSVFVVRYQMVTIQHWITFYPEGPVLVGTFVPFSSSSFLLVLLFLDLLFFLLLSFFFLSCFVLSFIVFCNVHFPLFITEHSESKTYTHLSTHTHTHTSTCYTRMISNFIFSFSTLSMD